MQDRFKGRDIIAKTDYTGRYGMGRSMNHNTKEKLEQTQWLNVCEDNGRKRK